MNKISLALLALGISMSYTSLNAITLKASIVDMLKTNPTILENLSDYRAAKESLNIAKSNFRPKVDLDGDATRQRTRKGSSKTIGNSYGAGIQLSQNIFNGFSDKNNIKKQEALVLASAYRFLDGAQIKIAEMVEVYLDVLKNKDLSGMEKESLNTHHKIYSMLKEKVDNGTNTQSDLTQMESKVSLAYSNYVLVRKNYQDALAKYYKVLGRFELESNFEIVHDNIKLPETFERASDISLQYHPALKVQKYNVVASKKEFDISKGAFYPKLDFVARHGLRNNSADDNTEITTQGGFEVNYNLYNGNADEYTRQKTLSDVHKQFERKNQTKRDLLQGVRLAWVDQELIAKQIPHLIRYKDLSDQTLNAYYDEFQIGRRTLTELLDSENNYKSAKSEEVTARYGYLLEKFRLLESMGVIENYFNLDLRRAVDLDNNPIKVRNIQDSYYLDTERDRDVKVDDLDVCDNSKSGARVGPSGCAAIPTEGNFVNNIDFTAPARNILDNIDKEVKDDIQKMIEAPTIQPLNFIYRKTELVDESKARVRRVVTELLKISPYIKTLVVFAHTDSIASKKYNKGLSLRRANAIKNTLISYGMPEDKIETRGMGEEFPLVPNTSKSNRLQNRRVEFQIILDENINLNNESVSNGNDLVETVTTTGNDLVENTYVTSSDLVVDGDILASSSILRNVPVVKFQRRSYKLTRSSKNALADMVSGFNDKSRYKVEIFAHTDSRGKSDANKKLSNKRAEIVKYELIKLGLRANNIEAYGMGEDYPISSNETSNGRAKNRRVELKIVRR